MLRFVNLVCFAIYYVLLIVSKFCPISLNVSSTTFEKNFKKHFKPIAQKTIVKFISNLQTLLSRSRVREGGKLTSSFFISLMKILI